MDVLSDGVTPANGNNYINHFTDDFAKRLGVSVSDSEQLFSV